MAEIWHVLRNFRVTNGRRKKNFFRHPVRLHDRQRHTKDASPFFQKWLRRQMKQGMPAVSFVSYRCNSLWHNQPNTKLWNFFCATTAKQAFIFAGSTIFYLKYTVRSGKRALSDRSGRVCLYCCATKDSPMLWLLDNC